MSYYKLSIKDRASFYADMLILKPLEANWIKRISQKRRLANIIIEAIQNRMSVQQLSSNLGHNWNDLTVDWNWISHHILTDSFNIKRAKEIENYQGKDALVYKQVFREDCPACQNVYLNKPSNGIDSEPKLFKLSDLIKNGHNLKFNLNKFKPVIGATVFDYNPDIENFNWDFSSLESVPEHSKWDEIKKSFTIKLTDREKEIRSKIKLTVTTDDGQEMSYEDFKKKEY